MTAHVEVMDLVAQMKAAEQAFVLATVVRHDRIRLTIEVSPISDDILVRPAAVSAESERSLGRDELSIWLARILLDVQDCKLETRMGPDRLTIVADFEQALQADFFARRA